MTEFWIWLNTPPTIEQVLDPFAVVYLVAFGTGFVASAYLHGPAAAPLSPNSIHRVGIVHWSHVGLWIFGPGLFFFLVRALQINPLSMGEPIWLVSSIVAAAVAGIRCVHWWRTTYPALFAEGHDEAGVTRQQSTPGLTGHVKQEQNEGVISGSRLPPPA